MIVDYLRTGRRQWARLYRDRPDVLTRIRWYRAAPTAKQLPIPYTYGFVIYDDDVRFENLTAPGFVGDIDHFTKGVNHGQPGLAFDGPADSFLYGALYNDPRLPPCVQWQGYWHGRFVVNGSWELLEFFGGLLMHGIWGDVTDGYTGSVVLHGSFLDAPENFTGRLVLTALVGDDDVYHGCQAKQTISPSLSQVGQLARFQHVNWDTDHFFNLGVDQTEMKIPFTGIYTVYWLMDVGSGTADNVLRDGRGELLVNGADTDFAVGGAVSRGASSVELDECASVQILLTAGDIVQLNIFTDSLPDGAVNVICYLGCEYRGPLP